jgi:hypothetical protein
VISFLVIFIQTYVLVRRSSLHEMGIQEKRKKKANVYNVLFGKPQAQIPFGRRRHR